MENTNDLNRETEKLNKTSESRPGEIEKVGGPIELETARKWTQNYRRTHEKDITSHLFGRKVIEKILKQKNCKGIRIHYSIDDRGKKQLILSGVDSYGNDQLPNRKQKLKTEPMPQALQAAENNDYELYDQSWPCPGTSGCPSNELTNS